MSEQCFHTSLWHSSIRHRQPLHQPMDQLNWSQTAFTPALGKVQLVLFFYYCTSEASRVGQYRIETIGPGVQIIFCSSLVS